MESLVTYNIFLTLCPMLCCRYLNGMSVIVPTYCFLALMDEAIYKLIFGISIYGTA